MGFTARKEGRMDKEEMIAELSKLMHRMYYEDVEFFYNFVTGYAKKKGIT